jgi:hypothetical protein
MPLSIIENGMKLALSEHEKPFTAMTTDNSRDEKLVLRGSAQVDWRCVLRIRHLRWQSPRVSTRQVEVNRGSNDQRQNHRDKNPAYHCDSQRLQHLRTCAKGKRQGQHARNCGQGRHRNRPQTPPACLDHCFLR